MVCPEPAIFNNNSNKFYYTVTNQPSTLFLTSNFFKKYAARIIDPLLNNHPWLISPQPIEDEDHEGNINQKVQRCKEVARTPYAHLLLVIQNLTDKGYISVAQATQFFDDNQLYQKPNGDNIDTVSWSWSLSQLISNNFSSADCSAEAIKYLKTLLQTPFNIIAEDTSTFLYFEKSNGERVTVTSDDLEILNLRDIIDAITRVGHHHQCINGDSSQAPPSLSEVCEILFGEHAAKYFSHFSLEDLFKQLLTLEQRLREENGGEGKLSFEFVSLVSGVRLYPDGRFDTLETQSGTSTAYLASEAKPPHSFQFLQLGHLLIDESGTPLWQSLEDGQYAVQIALNEFLRQNYQFRPDSLESLHNQSFSPYLGELSVAIIGRRILENGHVLKFIKNGSELNPYLQEFTPKEALELHLLKDPIDPLTNSAVFILIPPGNHDVKAGLEWIELVLGLWIQNSAVGDQNHQIFLLNEQNNDWLSFVKEILQATVNNQRTPYHNGMKIIEESDLCQNFDELIRAFGQRPLPHTGVPLSCDIPEEESLQARFGIGFFGASKAEVPLAVLQQYREFWSSLVEALTESCEKIKVRIDKEFILKMKSQGLPLHEIAGVTFSSDDEDLTDQDCRSLIEQIGNDTLEVNPSGFYVEVPMLDSDGCSGVLKHLQMWDGGGSSPGQPLPAQTLMGLFGQNCILFYDNEGGALQVIRPKGVSTPNLLVQESGPLPSGHDQLKVVETIHRRQHEVLFRLGLCCFFYGGIGTVHEAIGAARRELPIILIPPSDGESVLQDPVLGLVAKLLTQIDYPYKVFDREFTWSNFYSEKNKFTTN